MKFPLFIASGQQAVSELIGWFIVVPMASVFSLLSLWFAFKRWRVAAIVASLLTFALVALLMSDTPIAFGWVPAACAALGLGGAIFLKRLPPKEEANQISQPTPDGVADR